MSEAVREAAIAAARLGGGVYFVRALKAKRIKIGFAASPLARMLSLFTGSPETYQLAAVIPGDRKIEAYMHDWFKGSRAKGEWFDESSILLDFISSASSNPMLDFKEWRWLRDMENVVPIERDKNN
ncbi:GIY-YIG nuclease family protein [Rhizobium sp. SGZ-381]|uniref:GIY-YIG nuclease family protein n=1 Tax=Rhizobium sp. SGZ-381 TaxID=3342800 RepID=UPI00367200E9